MNPNDYCFSFTTEASPSMCMDRIKRIPDWWTRHFKGSAERIDDTFSVTFGETFVNFVVADEIPDKRIRWRVTDCNLQWISDKKEWLGTEVIWGFDQHGAKTTVTMTHAGLFPTGECYERCEQGWNFYLGKSLPKYIDDGIGMPDRDKAARAA